MSNTLSHKENQKLNRLAKPVENIKLPFKDARFGKSRNSYEVMAIHDDGVQIMIASFWIDLENDNKARYLAEQLCNLINNRD